jgi:ornithine cyclodeaminase
MPAVHSLDAILRVLPSLDLLPAIEAGFVAHAEGRALVPPVGELLFPDAPGDAHIKYGHLVGDDVFVIKVATGFPGNPARGLPSFSGVMLVFRADTGLLESVLMDEGHLTNVRTAMAGAICARHLAPTDVDRLAVFGTGVQARLQVEAIAPIVGCRKLIVWGRRDEALAAYASEMAAKGFAVETTRRVAEAADGARLLVTTTPSESPLLDDRDVAPGALVIAMGSDTAHKQELTAALLGAVDVYVADSVDQCATRGELHHALRAGTRGLADVIALGDVVRDPARGRRNPQQRIVADLTGVAVQDIAIAKAVSRALALPIS